ncbi:MAG: hypothetical protein IJF27_06040, partial [Oscillospiraceae bacterium]|nr:hypothetical protein [Oscillospiraceae bacterium]
RAKKIIMLLAAAAVAVLLFSCVAVGGTEDIFNEAEKIMEDSGLEYSTEGLSSATKELMEELGIADMSVKSLMSLSPKAFLRLMLKLAAERMKDPLKSAAAVVGISVICAAAEALKLKEGNSSVSGVVNVVGALCCSAVIIFPAMSIIERVCGAINECADFLLSFVPVYVSVMTAGGQVSSAAAYNTALFGVAQVYSNIANGILKPLTGIFLAFSTVGAIAPGLGLSNVAGSVKKTVNWILAFISTVFVAVLGLQASVTTAADGVAAKAVKFAVSSAVPVVGGALSEAMSSAAGYIGLLKSASGTFGIFVGAAIFLPPLAECALWSISLSLAAAVVGMTGAAAVSNTAKAASDVFGILFSLTLCMLLQVIVVIGITLAVKG